jgi:pimeloyl-ACP methyl ester carboxylesterase
MPTLILWGKKDSVTPLEQAMLLHSHIPKSKLHFIDKAGHMANLEQAEEYNRYLYNFISDVLFPIPIQAVVQRI